MRRLVIFTEEPTMQIVLTELCARLLPPQKPRLIIASEGWRNLEQKFPREMLRHANSDFIVTRDEDAHDCNSVKQKISNLISPPLRRFSKIRIVCNELESWYLGTPLALHKANLMSHETMLELIETQKSIDNDKIKNAKEQLITLINRNSTQKLASEIAPHLSEHRETTSSTSFKHMIKAIEGFANA